VLRSLGHLFIACAMFSVIGGQWAVLQTVAWTGMIIENAQKSPLSTAIRDTFNGEKPCNLCHVVKEGREQERKLPAALNLKKFEVWLVSSQQVPAPRESEQSYPPLIDLLAPFRSYSPPSPVPILAIRSIA